MPALLLRIRSVLTQGAHALWKRRTRPLFLGIAAVLLLATGAVVHIVRSSAPPPRVALRLVHPPWDCAQTTAHLLQAVFDMRTDQEIRLAEVSAIEMWKQVATGEADGGVAAWLPETHKEHRNQYGRHVVILDPFLEGARMGLAVMDGREEGDAGRGTDAVRSIADLRGRAEFYNNRITGLDPAFQQMHLTREAMETYGLEGYLLREGTVRTIKETLDAAQAAGTPVVVSIWSPHWLFGRHGLRWLEDPRDIFGAPESIHFFVHPTLREKAPDADAILRRIRLSPLELGSAMERIRTAAHPELAARQWVRDHAALVDSWLATEE